MAGPFVTHVATHQGHMSRLITRVELRGFEPLTSSMPWKRATNCAIAPWLRPRTCRSNSAILTDDGRGCEIGALPHVGVRHDSGITRNRLHRRQATPGRPIV